MLYLGSTKLQQLDLIPTAGRDGGEGLSREQNGTMEKE